MSEAPLKSANALFNTADAVYPGDFADCDLHLRIRSAASEKGWKQKDLADRSGVPAGRINEYWNGKREPGATYLFAMAAALSVSAEWLATGQGPRMASDDDDFVGVQEIDLAYGLGGTFANDPVSVHTHRFPRAWIEAITTTPASMLTFARGRGDSMQPTIQDGDMVLIDRSQKTVREWDAVWALTIGEMAMIKRVRVRGEQVSILSDNDRVPSEQVFHEEINVVGRVIFIGRKI